MRSIMSTDLCEGWRSVQAFGTKYLHRQTQAGDDVWLTELGWHYREHLAPEAWLADDAYTRLGHRLSFSTGHVYRVSVAQGRRRLSFVAKLSRVGQRLCACGLLDTGTEPPTSFMSPFEEVAALNGLRQSKAPSEYLFTKRPLAIVSPSRRIPAWMLDRVGHEFTLATRRLSVDATLHPELPGVTLEPDRDYFTLLSWVHGHNLEELVAMGRLSLEEMRAIDREVRARLTRVGFLVADHKPNHIIVRLDPSGAPRRRRGKLVVALADFELLGVAQEHEGRPATNTP